MLTAILVTLIIVAALGVRAALERGSRDADLAASPYNNRYNDASGARDDHLG